MCWKTTVHEPRLPDSEHCAVCLYASFFLHASITIMATVCRFFPSQLVGVLRPSRKTTRKKNQSLPYSLHRQTGLSIAHWWRWRFCTLLAEREFSLFTTGVEAARARLFRNPSARWRVSHQSDDFRPASRKLLVAPKFEGYEYVG